MCFRARTISVSLFGSFLLIAGFSQSRRQEAKAGAATSQGHVALAPCHLGDVGLARCGAYEVYENRAIRSGRKVSLNVVVLPAEGAHPAPEPVFWLDGGPGIGATGAIPLAKTGFLEVLRKDHDLVFVDQRGTGKSNGLYCDVGDDPADLASFFGKLFPQEAVRACREKLEKTADLRLYTTSIAMDDLDEVREALGYRKVNLVAASYGSIAAQVYMRQHPGNVRAAFLAGVATPGIKQPLLFAPAAQHALDLLFVDCAADHECNSAFPNLKSEFDSVLSRFDHGPLEVKMLNVKTKQMQTVRLERENYVERIRLLLYTTFFGRFVPLIVHRAYAGDFLPLEAVAIRYNPGGLISRGMYLSVTCSEGIPFITEPEIVSQAKGTFVGETRVRSHIRACEEWPRGDVAASFIAPVRSTLPVLLISGEVDGSTPPWFGEEAVKYFQNGKQLKVRYYGHQIQGPCILGIEQRFIQSGSVQGIDSSCVDTIRRPPFATELPAAMALQ